MMKYKEENKVAKYVMALDQGTTSSRCIIFDRHGNVKAIARKEFEQIFPQPGWVEHDPMEIWSSQLAVAIEAMAKKGIKAQDIAGIGITNQRETTIVWNKETGEPIYNAIVWQCPWFFCHYGTDQDNFTGFFADSVQFLF